MPAGADVFHQPPDPSDNRWQRGSVIEALYFADCAQTVWAEWYRWLAEAGLPPQQGLPHELWRWEISLPDVVDLRGEDRLGRVGLPTMIPTRTQWPTFQPIGEGLYRKGTPALLAASAARPEGEVLCVFRSKRKVSGTRPLPPPTTVTDPPVVPTGMRT